MPSPAWKARRISSPRARAVTNCRSLAGIPSPRPLSAVLCRAAVRVTRWLTLPMGRLLLNGRLFSAKRKLPPPFPCRNAQGGGFDVRTCKAAMSQMRVLSAGVVQGSHLSPKSTFPCRTPNPGHGLARERRHGYSAAPPQEAPMAKEPIVHKDIVSLSFEDALKELEGIVQQLE